MPPGYSERVAQAVQSPQAMPEDADLGNPQALAAMRPGAAAMQGSICFPAARLVGPAGRVIGVDMSHEMLTKARVNAEHLGAANVASSRRGRAPADRRQQGRRGDLELRHQLGSRQAASLP
jgi:hypothetical protein